jgi:hypothetical protein
MRGINLFAYLLLKFNHGVILCMDILLLGLKVLCLDAKCFRLISVVVVLQGCLRVSLLGLQL